jgi:hypothetical protein
LAITTDAEIARALRSVYIQMAKLYFDFYAFSQYSDEDLTAIISISCTKTVKNKVPDHELNCDGKSGKSVPDKTC